MPDSSPQSVPSEFQVRFLWFGLGWAAATGWALVCVAVGWL